MPHDPRDYVVDLKVTLPISIPPQEAHKIATFRVTHNMSTARGMLIKYLLEHAWRHPSLPIQLLEGVLVSLDTDELKVWTDRLDTEKATFRVKNLGEPKFTQTRCGFGGVEYEAEFIANVRVLFDTPPSEDDLIPEDFKKIAAEGKR